MSKFGQLTFDGVYVLRFAKFNDHFVAYMTQEELDEIQKDIDDAFHNAKNGLLPDQRTDN
jgi:hypothetical protein